MNNRIIQMLRQTSVPGLIDSIEKSYISEDELDPDTYIEDADRLANASAAESLAKHAKISKLSDVELSELSEACMRWSVPHSSRILLCGSKSQIQDLQPGDTVITPDGVWQIHADFQEQAILSKKEMSAAIPAELQPKSDSTLTIVTLEDEPTAHSQKLTEALNKSMVKKTNSLYVSGELSQALQHTQSVIQTLRSQHLEKELAHRKLNKFIFKALKIKNVIQLHGLAKNIAQECLEYYTKRAVEIFAADEVTNYAIATFPRNVELRKWTDQELKILSYACFTYQPQLSPRIIRAGSPEIISSTEHFKLNEGDTVIFPNRVMQIDHASVIREVLNKKEMERHIPSSMIPEANSPIATILCKNPDEMVPNSDDSLLINSLNHAFQDSSTALYLGNDGGAEEKIVMDVLTGIAQVVNEELQRRSSKKNLVFKALGVKTDAEFLKYFLERLYPGTMEPLKLNEHVEGILQESKRINFALFTDAELRDLCEQCETWVPKISSRILVSRSFPEDYHIDDTIILPDGIYQIRIDASSGKIKQEKLVDQTTLDTLDIADYFPSTSKAVHIYDDYSKENVQQLARILNPIILKKPNGMYLYEIPSRESESYGAVKKVLKNMAKQELGARALQHFKGSQPQKSRFNFSGFSLFGAHKKVAPAVTNDQPDALNTESSRQKNPEFPRAKMNRKQLIAGAARIKDLQKKLHNPSPLAQKVEPSTTTMILQSHDMSDVQRTIPEVRAAINEVKLELEHTLSLSLSTVNGPDETSVQILQDKRVFMEASKDTVAMHKPLLKAKMNNEVKAELFLQALGIPPTEGKQKVEVRGGHHALRKAVRELFQTFKARENLQKKADPDDSDQETVASSHHNL